MNQRQKRIVELIENGIESDIIDFKQQYYHEAKKSEFIKDIISFANAYAKECGFDRTYIPSEHVGLYEKYGYQYLKDIVNYGNGIDRLYVKQLD